jgi:hypothetical protein
MAAGVPSLLFLPWAVATLVQSAAARGWRAPSGLDTIVWRSLETVVHFDVLGGPGGAAATVLVGGLAILGLLRARPTSRLLLGLTIALPLIAAFALSAFKPIFAERYLVATAVPLYASAALGVAALGRGLRSTALVAVGIVALLAAALIAFQQPAFEKENFRAAAERVAASAQPSDTILFVAEFARRPFEYYYQGPGSLVGFFGDHRNPGSVLQPLADTASTIWLVESHTERYDPDHQVRAWLAERFPLVTEAYPQGINVRAFRTQSTVPAPPGSPIATFGDLELGGATFPASVAARDRFLHPPSGWLPVTLTWTAKAQPETDYRLVLELADGRGVWGRSLERPNDLFHLRPTSRWQPGTTALESADVNLNPDTPPGSYTLQLAVFDAAGQPVPSTPPGPIQLGPVEVR